MGVKAKQMFAFYQPISNHLQSIERGVQHYLVFCSPAWAQDAWTSSCDCETTWRRGLGEVGMRVNQQLQARLSEAHLKEDATCDVFCNYLL